MQTKHKEILVAHRTFLLKNIVWNSQLAGLLKQNGLLSDSMLSDVENAGKRQEKVQALLDLLPLRGSNSFEKFVDILQLTGHTFLADFLREEDSGAEVLDVKDLYRRLPQLMKTLRDSERKILEQYLAEKMQAEQLKFIWKKEAKEKDKALDAQLKQIEQAYEFEEETKSKENQISGLEKEIKDAQEECIALRAQLRAAERAYQDLQEKHKEELSVQMRYNMANENQLQRNDEKAKTTENMLNNVYAKLRSVMTFQERNNETDAMARAANEFTFLSDDIDVFVAQFKQLQEIKRKYEDLLEERKWILGHLGFSGDEANGPGLLPAYKAFAVQNEEQITTMRKELARYGELMEEHKTKTDNEERKFNSGAAVWQNAIMSVMRKQLQDLKTTLRKKETHASIQEQEISKLKARINELENGRPKAFDLEREKPLGIVETNHVNGTHSESPDSLNGHVSTGGMDSRDEKSPSPRGKMAQLPPLKYPSAKRTSHSPKPIIVKPRHTASMPRNYHHESGIKPALPEGLTTAPVKIESRSKHPTMTSGLGDLKAMHHRSRNSFSVERGSVDKFSLGSKSTKKDTRVK